MIASSLFIYFIINFRMQEVFESHIETEDEREQGQHKYSLNFKPQIDEKAGQERQRYLEPPISIPSRHYSLEPDCIGGWKPKNAPKPKPKYVNVFPLRYDEEIVDEIVKQLAKNKTKHNEALIYLGPRKPNSYILHQNRSYPNPYKLENRMSPSIPGRSGVPANNQLRKSYLKFNSDFQSGNLDAVVQRSSDEFDLFMRVDTNTKGHTNWYYFEVLNEVFIGTVTFNICNFRRPVSLYQRGLRPYVWSKEKKQLKWVQQGEDVKYERQRPRYRFLQNNNQEIANPMLNTFYALTFTFKFQIPHDVVRFAYSPPYGYSQLTQFLNKLENHTKLTPLKSLSSLPIPVLKITNEEQDEASKKAVLVTGRIHPGESNSSYVSEGFLQFLCSSELVAKQLRTKYIFYVIPMLNPDGVVAGNYRTSLFGKDLNRTFNQSRRYAFPQIFYLLRFAQEIKKLHKKRFCLYIDLHGHSVKKNVFMYGPDYSLQDFNYEISRELPKILGNMTNYFRYYSCSFRISDSKSSTGRAVFNRALKIPYTYTMQSSNGCYFDFATHTEIPFTIDKWKEMGVFLAKSLNLLRLQRLPKIARTYTLKITKKIHYIDDKPNQPVSDDEINEEDSDMEPLNEDLSDEILNQIEMAVKGNNEDEEKIKSLDVSLNEGCLTDKKKKKNLKLEEYSRRKPKNESITSKPDHSKQSCAYQIPQRKNISFPSVFPNHRAEIFISRQSRHDKYQMPLQMRFRKNESQANKKIEIHTKNSISSSKIAIQAEQHSQQLMHKKEFNFNDLIKKYKFNF